MPRMRDSRYFLCPQCESYSSLMTEASDWCRTYKCVSCDMEFKWFDGSMPVRKDGQLVGFTRNFQGDA